MIFFYKKRNRFKKIDYIFLFDIQLFNYLCQNSNFELFQMQLPTYHKFRNMHQRISYNANNKRNILKRVEEVFEISNAKIIFLENWQKKI